MNEITLRKKLYDHAKPAWKPIVVDRDDDPFASKYGGTPCAPRKNPWPTCQLCGRLLQFILQIDCKNAPLKPRSIADGWIQLFYCTAAPRSGSGFCAADAQPFDPFSGAKIVRLIPRSEEMVPQKTPHPTQELQPRTVEGWEPFLDLPGAINCEQFGIPLTPEEEELSFDMELPYRWDKLGGWPYWPSAAPYPQHPQTGDSFSPWLQIASDMALDYAWADGRTGYIFSNENATDFIFFW